MARDIQTAAINVNGFITIIPDIRKMTVLPPEEFYPHTVLLLYFFRIQRDPFFRMLLSWMEIRL